MRVMLLTQWFDPEPTFKGLAFARALAKRGFEVEVVTGFPNYPGGKVYPGYSIKLLQREQIDGIKVTRVPLFPSHDRSKIRRVLNYFTFAASSSIYCLFFAKHSDVLYAYHPPLTTGIVAMAVRVFRGIPVVYDVQDMWPDTLRATGMIGNVKVLAFVGKVCDLVYSRVDHIVVLSPGFKRLLGERGISGSKVEVIYNWADESSLAGPTSKLPDGFPPPERFRILFAGNMGSAQGLGTLLVAAEHLQRQNSRVVFVLLGGGLEVDELKREAAERRLENVVFFPPVPMNEVGIYLGSADALLVHLRKDPLFAITIPSKTQAYMAVGKPVLMAVDGDAAALVQAAGCGIVAKSEDWQDLVRAAEELAALTEPELAAFAANGRTYYDSHLSSEIGVDRFANLFRRIAST